MVFVRSSISIRGSKTSPKSLTTKMLEEYAANGNTIAEISKLENVWESEARKHITINYPDLLIKFKDNQKGRFMSRKQPKLKPIVFKEPKISNLPLAEYYRKAIKTYRAAVICADCQYIVAHTNLDQIHISLACCPICGTPTVLGDVNHDLYRKCILFKKNHITSEQFREREDLHAK